MFDQYCARLRNIGVYVCNTRVRKRFRIRGIAMNEIDIQDFWNHNPCGDYQVGGLASRQGNYESFFNDYDRFRYEQHSHLLKCLDDIQFEGKTVLEVGLANLDSAD